jgi:hypothetical protein
LESKNFIEVETPMLQNVYGGATAKPFVTVHNDLKQSLFLRIALELPLKRLIVGGFERIFEIGRVFRNEGVSYKHNPEYTLLELYQAYADYNDIMALTESLIADIVLKTNGSADLEWWKESKKYLTDVVISVHKEFCNLNHIDSVIELLQENKEIHPINVSILIPLTHIPSHWQWGVRTLNHYRTKFNLGNLQLLYSNFARGSDTYYPYTEEQWQEYAMLQGVSIPRSVLNEEEKIQVQQQETSHVHVDIKVRDPLDFKGVTCYAGIDTLVIDYNGLVWRGWCSYGGPIGSIYELPIQFPTEPIVCGLSRCGNGFDQQARKER